MGRGLLANHRVRRFHWHYGQRLAGQSPHELDVSIGTMGRGLLANHCVRRFHWHYGQRLAGQSEHETFPLALWAEACWPITVWDVSIGTMGRGLLANHRVRRFHWHYGQRLAGQLLCETFPLALWAEACWPITVWDVSIGTMGRGLLANHRVRRFHWHYGLRLAGQSPRETFPLALWAEACWPITAWDVSIGTMGRGLLANHPRETFPLALWAEACWPITAWDVSIGTMGRGLLANHRVRRFHWHYGQRLAGQSPRETFPLALWAEACWPITTWDVSHWHYGQRLAGQSPRETFPLALWAEACWPITARDVSIGTMGRGLLANHCVRRFHWHYGQRLAGQSLCETFPLALWAEACWPITVWDVSIGTMGRGLLANHCVRRFHWHYGQRLAGQSPRETFPLALWAEACWPITVWDVSIGTMGRGLLANHRVRRFHWHYGQRLAGQSPCETFPLALWAEACWPITAWDVSIGTMGQRLAGQSPRETFPLALWAEACWPITAWDVSIGTMGRGLLANHRVRRFHWHYGQRLAGQSPRETFPLALWAEACWPITVCETFPLALWADACWPITARDVSIGTMGRGLLANHHVRRFHWHYGQRLAGQSPRETFPLALWAEACWPITAWDVSIGTMGRGLLANHCVRRFHWHYGQRLAGQSPAWDVSIGTMGRGLLANHRVRRFHWHMGRGLLANHRVRRFQSILANFPTVHPLVHCVNLWRSPFLLESWIKSMFLES